MKYLTQYVPQGSGDGSDSMKFYKCASVDTSNKTWSGYELVRNDGKYSVSSGVTTGLTYTSVMPSAGFTYSEDALIRVYTYYSGIPTDGLLFMAPLTSEKETDDTGKNLFYNGTYSFTENAFDAQEDGFINTNICSWFPQGSNPWTIGVKVKVNEGTTPDSAGVLGIFRDGITPTNSGIGIYTEPGCIRFTTHGTGSIVFESSCKIDYSLFHSVVIVYNGTEISFFVDNNHIGSHFATLNTSVAETPIYIGRGYQPEGYTIDAFNGLIKDIVIYNRVLSQDEINILSNEFTPTA